MEKLQEAASKYCDSKYHPQSEYRPHAFDAYEQGATDMAEHSKEVIEELVKALEETKKAIDGRGYSAQVRRIDEALTKIRNNEKQRKDMTDLERIKNEVALEFGFEDWTYAMLHYHTLEKLQTLDNLYNIVMQRYAELKCKEEVIKAYDKGVKDFASYDPERHGNVVPTGEEYYNRLLATSKTT